MSIKQNSRDITKSTEAQQSHSDMLGKDCEKSNVFKRWQKTERDRDDWMSDGSEFQRSDASAGNVRQLTVVSWSDGTSS